MKRQRPPMPPLAVRVHVAERQFLDYHDGLEWIVYEEVRERWSLAVRLKYLLRRIFEDGENVAPHALDHDPALILRIYNDNPLITDIAARYIPYAHDHKFLIYREKSDHQQKTTGRKPGAERTITTKGSDVGLAAKFRRLEAKPSKKRAVRARKWPKRKLQSRGFRT
jgi:hypothetical protein